MKCFLIQVCFSNEFSTITHKVVYFDLTSGNEKPLLESMDRSTALSQVAPRRFPAVYYFQWFLAKELM